MVQCCSVMHCHSRSPRGNEPDYGIKFFSFPAWKRHQGPQMDELTKRRRMAWISAVRRKELNISKYSRVCSRHFHKGKPAMEMYEWDPDWAPSLHLGHTQVKPVGLGRLERGNNRRQAASIQSNAADPATAPEDEDSVESRLQVQINFPGPARPVSITPDLNILHLVVCKEEVSPIQERSLSLLQEEPEPPHIKEEQEELLLGQDEADGSLAVKSEDNEDTLSHCSEIEVELEADSEVTEDSDNWDETSGGDEDSDSSHDAHASTSFTGARSQSAATASTNATGARSQSAATARKRRQQVVWETVQQQNSAKDIPMWKGALPTADGVREPIEYFRDFFDADLLDTIVEQSNLFCMRNNPNRALKLDRNELEQFIGTLVYMSIIRVPMTRMYWSSECRIAQVADVMSRDRWVEIKRFLHFNDDSNMAADEDKLFKIRPIADSLLQKCQALPLDQMLSLDEQIVPFKGRGHNPKPHKAGYKIFVLRDTKGLVYSFNIYTRRINPVPLPGEPDVGLSGNIALQLAHIIPGGVNHLLYCDEWFSSMDLFVALANKGIPALGTVEQVRLQGCRFISDRDLIKKGKGAFEENKVVVNGVEIRATKWFDDRELVTVASTFASAQPVSITEKWDRKLKRKVETECPSIISLCNKFIGGDDALDPPPIACHRIRLRSKKYYQRLFFHFVDMVISNSWLLYQRDCESLGVPGKKRKHLLDFRSSVAQALCMQGKDMSRKKREWSSSIVERECEKKKHRGAEAIPALEVRTDAVGHWW